MNWLEELSLGALLATFRERLHRSGAQIAPLMPPGYTTTSGVSRLENNYSSRPSREFLEEIAPVYGLTPHEITYLYRAADHEPNREEVRALRVRMQSTLDEFLCPAYILDYRLRLVTWNEAFARLYTGSPEPVEPGLSLLRLLFYTGGRPRVAVGLDVEDWSRLVEFWLTRFWRSMSPLIQVNWNPPTGQPNWLTELLGDLEALPSPDGEEFTRRSEQIRPLVTGKKRDERVELIHHDLVGCPYVRQKQARSLLTVNGMADTRFHLVLQIPVGD